jgi:UDP-glucose 4-epimerase
VEPANRDTAEWSTLAKRILITGGAGFVGSHLVERLASEGKEVHVLDDLSRGRRDWLPESVPLHPADLRDQDSVRQILGDVLPEGVIHLAALHFIPAVDGAPELAWQVNVEGTKTLLESLKVHPPHMVLFASTAAVYPDCSRPISEACPVAPVDLYGKTKVAGEELLARFQAEVGVRLVIARLFNVIGKRETNPHVVPEIVGQLRNGGTHLRLGRLDSIRDYIDVIDVADALSRLLRPNLPHTVFNVGSGRGTSVANLVSICERVLSRSVSVGIDQTRLRGNDRKELVADIQRLTSTTGWSPKRPIEETLRNLLLGE